MEKLIKFDTAKLAKEKGFDLDCSHFYCKNSTCDYIDEPYEYSFKVNANEDQYRNGKIDNFGYGETWSAPTQSQLQTWLRNNNNLYINIFPYFGTEYDSGVQGYELLSIINLETEEPKRIRLRFETYEGALEQALIESLLLI